MANSATMNSLHAFPLNRSSFLLNRLLRRFRVFKSERDPRPHVRSCRNRQDQEPGASAGDFRVGLNRNWKRYPRCIRSLAWQRPNEVCALAGVQSDEVESGIAASLPEHPIIRSLSNLAPCGQCAVRIEDAQGWDIDHWQALLATRLAQ